MTDPSQLSDAELMAALGMASPAPARPATTRPQDMSRGERNANAGNIKDGAWARSQPGYIGSDGTFARFDSEASGNAAQENLLRTNYLGKGYTTPAAIVNRYAPVGPENSQESVTNYINYISRRAGIDPNGNVPADKLPILAQAMREFETGNTQGGMTPPVDPQAADSAASLSDEALLAAINQPETPTDPNAQQGTRANPIDLRGKLYNDQIPLLVKGAWAIDKDGKPFQLTGDAFQGQPTSNSVFQPGSRTYVRPPNAYDATEAFVTAAGEQVPFLDEVAALAGGALNGRGYSATREQQNLTKELLNQTNRGERIAGGLAGFGLSFAAPGAGYIGKGANAAEKAIRAAQVGGGLGALYGAGGADGGLGERAQAGLEGGALGAVTGGLLQRGGDRLAESVSRRAMERAANPSNARILSNAGVELTPGQMFGGAFKRIEDGLTSIPFMGDAIKSSQRRGLESFNDAAISGTLEQVGATATGRGRERMRNATQAFNRAYSEALDPVTSIPRPEGYAEALSRIADDTALPPNLRRNLRSLIANTVGRADEAIDGGTWKKIDSELSADIRAADNAATNAPEQRLLRDKLGDVRDLWSERLGAVYPEALAAVRNADDAYSTFKIIQKATADVASAGRGAEASPATLNRAVRQSAGEGRYSRGEGRLQQLTDAATQVMPSSVPDSGTPLRSLLTAGGLGGGAAAFGNPVGQALAALSGLGIAAGSAAYSSPVQRAANAAYRAIGREGTTEQALSLLDVVHQNPAAVPLYMQLLERLQQEQGAPSVAPPAVQTLPPAQAQAR